MLAFIDSGPFILMESQHAVLAAPYHRNQAGNNAMLDMFLAAPDDAKAKMAAHGIDTVAFCPGVPERYDYAAGAPGPGGRARARRRSGFPGKNSAARQRSRGLSRKAVRRRDIINCNVIENSELRYGRPALRSLQSILQKIEKTMVGNSSGVIKNTTLVSTL